MPSASPIKLAREETQHAGLQQSYLTRAAIEAEKLKTLIEQIPRELKS